jgi:large subunit ribosomal protein L23
MPFNIAQILGGWRRKDNVRRKADKFSGVQLQKRKTQVISETADNILEAAEEKKAASPLINKGGSAWKFINSPHISEKAAMLGEGKYTFRVSDSTNKPSLKNAIESRYGVKVASINIVASRDKKRRRGIAMGIKHGFRKAIVTLKEGQTINQF